MDEHSLAESQGGLGFPFLQKDQFIATWNAPTGRSIHKIGVVIDIFHWSGILPLMCRWINRSPVTPVSPLLPAALWRYGQRHRYLDYIALHHCSRRNRKAEGKGQVEDIVQNYHHYSKPFALQRVVKEGEGEKNIYITRYTRLSTAFEGYNTKS